MAGLAVSDSHVTVATAPVSAALITSAGARRGYATVGGSQQELLCGVAAA